MKVIMWGRIVSGLSPHNLIHRCRKHCELFDQESPINEIDQVPEISLILNQICLPFCRLALSLTLL